MLYEVITNIQIISLISKRNPQTIQPGKRIKQEFEHADFCLNSEYNKNVREENQARGKEMITVVPFPGWLSISIVPPFLSTKSFTRIKPSPVRNNFV